MYDRFPSEYILPNNVYIDDYHMGEVWEYIPGIPGYFVSDHGRVWSEASQKFLKPKPLDNHGHLGFALCVNGQRHYVYLHRIMAQAFIPNPNRLPIVRHLDDEPSNNIIENLAWGTQRDNWRDSVRNGTAQPPRDEWREIGFQKTRIPVLGTNIKTGKHMRFRGQSEAARELGLEQSNVWKVLNGQRAHTGGWFFEYLPKEDGNNDD